MNPLALVIIFILFIACIISYKKNIYEYMFLALYPILPQYFAIEISNTLPLVSIGRIMIIILFLYIVQKRKYTFSKSLFISPKKYKALVIYFSLRIISNLNYFFSLNEAKKNILSIVFEEILLLILLSTIFTSKEKINKAILILVHVSSAVFLLSIIESSFQIPFSDCLYLVNRKLLNEHYYRLGIMRSSFTFGIPSFLATYCIIMIPFILYAYSLTKKNKYIIHLALAMVALLHTGCRAQIIFLSLLMLFIFLFTFKTYAKDFIKFFIKSCLVTILLLVALISIRPQLKDYYVNFGKSVLNEVGFHFCITSDTSDSSTSFGDNEDGSYSRLAQLSGIPYTLKQNPFFGLGAAAQNRRAMKYFWNGKWGALGSYDVGYVAIVGNEGLLGFVAYLILIIYAFTFTIQSNSPLNKVFICFIVGYLLCLWANDLLNQCFWPLFSLYFSVNIQQKK